MTKYDQKPDYADFDAPHKFLAIESIIAKRLIEHPNAMMSYSGGADSDIMLDLVNRVIKAFELPQIDYYFFNTGLEMEATKRHVKEVAEKYGITIHTERPKKSIVTAVRENGLPFLNKIVSEQLNVIQKKEISLSIREEYFTSNDKKQKRAELAERYEKSISAINFLCCCDKFGKQKPVTQLCIDSSKWLYEFLKENPIPFKVSDRCCDICKKNLSHRIEKNYDMKITGERKDEGGVRAVSTSTRSGCFYSNEDGKFRLRPLYYVSDSDKAWYKERYGVRYSDAYEVYGLTRTGCCGCPISYKAVEDLERIRPYEPNLVKAAWNVFGDSYRYRQQYVEYRTKKNEEEKKKKKEAKERNDV